MPYPAGRGWAAPTGGRADLPNRNTPTPAPQPDSGDDKNDKKDNAPIGAWINLQVAGVPAGGWSGVQWQNSAGGWVLRHSGVTSALIGASRVSQVEDVVAVLQNLDLSEQELQAIETILKVDDPR